MISALLSFAAKTIFIRRETMRVSCDLIMRNGYDQGEETDVSEAGTVPYGSVQRCGVYLNVPVC